MFLFSILEITLSNVTYFAFGRRLEMRQMKKPPEYEIMTRLQNTFLNWSRIVELMTSQSSGQRVILIAIQY